MKIINMVVAQMLKNELTEIRKIYNEKIDEEKKRLKDNLALMDNPEEFYMVKEKLKKLDKYGVIINSDDIVEVDLFEIPLYVSVKDIENIFIKESAETNKESESKTELVVNVNAVLNTDEMKHQINKIITRLNDLKSSI